MRTIVQIIVAVFALTVMAPGQAETGQPDIVDHTVAQARSSLDSFVELVTTPWVDFKVSKKDVECLARNIFYEAGSEPEEGKAAVGIVTINRVKDSRFGRSICDVVNQRTVFVKTRTVSETEVVQRGWFSKSESVTKTHVKTESVPICQFSWVCNFVRRPKITDDRWEESMRVATELLNDGYDGYRVKYSEALYFHSAGIRPPWARQKQYLGRIGGHIFYADRS
jgi:spore germination cell wall hydrolase CwlJ-like protein